MQSLLGLLPILIALVIAGTGANMLRTSVRWSAPYLSGMIFLLLGLERLALPYILRMLQPQPQAQMRLQ